MPLCDACTPYLGALSKVEPHAGMRIQASRKVRGIYGNGAGAVQFYVCETCGVTWGRDGDSKDPDASWYRAAPRR
jgi:hypothetical protein